MRRVHRHTVVAVEVAEVAAAAAVDTEAAWAAEAASMEVDLVVVGASTVEDFTEKGFTEANFTDVRL